MIFEEPSPPGHGYVYQATFFATKLFVDILGVKVQFVLMIGRSPSAKPSTTSGSVPASVLMMYQLRPTTPLDGSKTTVGTILAQLP